MSPAAPLLGTVASFDAARGWGTVSAEGGGDYEFHCTAIADGTRHIESGTRVCFVVQAGHRGRLEARALVGLSPS